MADFLQIRNACTKKLAEEAELRLQLRGICFKTIYLFTLYCENFAKSFKNSVYK